jgi:predicted membrane channel-forming protein YqfA (hemolysin III family)
MKEIVLLSHVGFGVGCILIAVWLFVDVLNANEGNLFRIKWMSQALAACMWLAFVVGGYWYVVNYKKDKAVILKGPWPFSHNYFMETKEHFVIVLLLLASYLPIAAANDLAANREARRLVLCVTALIAVLALMAEGHGAMVAMGVKVALLGKSP